MRDSEDTAISCVYEGCVIAKSALVGGLQEKARTTVFQVGFELSRVNVKLDLVCCPSFASNNLDLGTRAYVSYIRTACFFQLRKLVYIAHNLL